MRHILAHRTAPFTCRGYAQEKLLRILLMLFAMGVNIIIPIVFNSSSVFRGTHSSSVMRTSNGRCCCARNPGTGRIVERGLVGEYDRSFHHRFHQGAMSPQLVIVGGEVHGEHLVLPVVVDMLDLLEELVDVDGLRLVVQCTWYDDGGGVMSGRVGATLRAAVWVRRQPCSTGRPHCKLTHHRLSPALALGFLVVLLPQPLEQRVVHDGITVRELRAWFSVEMEFSLETPFALTHGCARGSSAGRLRGA